MAESKEKALKVPVNVFFTCMNDLIRHTQLHARLLHTQLHKFAKRTKTAINTPKSQ